MFNSTLFIALLAASGPVHARSAPKREPRSASPAQAADINQPAASTSPSVSGPVSPAAGFSQHLERGLALYDQGEYSSALREFEGAYEIQQLPRLLYNLARAHIQLGHAEDALGLYQKFLRLEPEAPDEIRRQARVDMKRAGAMIEATERIRAMKDRQPLAVEPPPAPTAPAQLAHRDQGPVPLYRRWWFWTALGGGAALLSGVTAAAAAGYRAAHPPLPADQVPMGISIYTIGL